MNYKKIGLRDISNLADEFPTYSLGELLYSAIRNTGATKVSDLLSMTDEDIANAIRNTIQVENE